MKNQQRRATLIYNPHAGPKRLTKQLADFIQTWEAAGWQVFEKCTRYPGHATELARFAAKEGHRLVFAAGGDGTISEVARGVLHTETALAPVPCGMGNTFTKELGLSSVQRIDRLGLGRVADKLLSGIIYRMDVAICDNDITWFLCVGTGIDAFVVNKIEPRMPRTKLTRRLSKLFYTIRCLHNAPYFPGIRANITVDGKTYAGEFLLVTVNNTRYYASHFLFNPEAVLDDGKVEVWMFRGKSLRDSLRHAIKIMNRTHHSDNENIIFVQGKEISVDTEDPFPYQRDGDPVGTTPFLTQVIPGALKVLVPEHIRKGTLFSGSGVRL
jgi:diacylglycerol kinase (ATP)